MNSREVCGLLSADGQTVYARAKGLASIRKDVTDFTPAGTRMKIARAFPTSMQTILDVDRLMKEQQVAQMFGVKR